MERLTDALDRRQPEFYCAYLILFLTVQTLIVFVFTDTGVYHGVKHALTVKKIIL